MRTFRELTDHGFKCEVVDELPNDGIVIAHHDHLPPELRPGPRQLLVFVVAEYHRHPFAQVQLVQNPCDQLVTAPSTLWPAFHVKHWPEAGLIPRSEERGSTFRNVAYFGAPQRLAAPLRSPVWERDLGRLGLRWRIAPRESWHDYSDIDAVVAVRNFDKRDHNQFPASKLYMAWCAGVPAILGHESAYRAERRNALDYIEATSREAIIEALIRLRDDQELRRAMMSNAALRANELTSDKLSARWQDLIERHLVPAHAEWCALDDGQRNAFFQARRQSYVLYRLRCSLKKAYAHVRLRMVHA